MVSIPLSYGCNMMGCSNVGGGGVIGINIEGDEYRGSVNVLKHTPGEDEEVVFFCSLPPSVQAVPISQGICYRRH